MTEALNIYQRINAIMADLSYIKKENKKINNQYTFVSHDAVSMAVQPKLVEHRVAVLPSVTNRVQDGNRTEVDIEVSFVNIDNPEDKFTVSFFGYGVDSQDKGPGKAFSYAKKYAFLQVFCLGTGDDPERDMIDHNPYDLNEKCKELIKKLKEHKKPRDYIDGRDCQDFRDRCIQANRDDLREKLKSAAEKAIADKAPKAEPIDLESLADEYMALFETCDDADNLGAILQQGQKALKDAGCDTADSIYTGLNNEFTNRAKELASK